MCRNWREGWRRSGQVKVDQHHHLGKIPKCKRTTSWMTRLMTSMKTDQTSMMCRLRHMTRMPLCFHDTVPAPPLQW